MMRAQDADLFDSWEVRETMDVDTAKESSPHGPLAQTPTPTPTLTRTLTLTLTLTRRASEATRRRRRRRAARPPLRG